MTKLEAVLAVLLLVSNYYWINKHDNIKHFMKVRNSILEDIMTTSQRKKYVKLLIKETSK